MRLFYTALLLVHLLGVLVWVGGMFLMHYVVRPAAAQLAPAQRLPLLAAVLGRFFFWVSISVVAILASGLGLILGAGGFRNAHLSVHLMVAIGLGMMAIYLQIRLVLYPRLRRAVSSNDLAGAAQQLDAIRQRVAINLALGVLTIAVATIGRALL
ncbi:MAG TPA: CopD family protein [Burkholderiaceae bacterium]|nr:CopD family protein [Burkholderiaceae bacterium]